MLTFQVTGGGYIGEVHNRGVAVTVLVFERRESLVRGLAFLNRRGIGKLIDEVECKEDRGGKIFIGKPVVALVSLVVGPAPKSCHL